MRTRDFLQGNGDFPLQDRVGGAQAPGHAQAPIISQSEDGRKILAVHSTYRFIWEKARWFSRQSA